MRAGYGFGKQASQSARSDHAFDVDEFLSWRPVARGGDLRFLDLLPVAEGDDIEPALCRQIVKTLAPPSAVSRPDVFIDDIDDGIAIGPVRADCPARPPLGPADAI